MIDENQLDKIEQEARSILDKAQTAPPSSLDARIKSLAHEALAEKIKLSETPVMQGTFTLMAAADDSLDGAVVLTDKNSGTILSAFVSRGKKHSYVVEIRPELEKSDVISRYVNHMFKILADGDHVASGTIDDNYISELVELDENRNTQPVWSFIILPLKES